MMGRSHLIIGTTVSLSVLQLAGMTVTAPAVTVALIGSLLPDIDEPNSLLVSKALPNSLIRLLQTILLPVAVFVYFYVQAKPWNLLLAILIAMVSFLPSRSLRKVLMFAIGLGLVFYGHAFAPWNLIAGSLLMLCTTLTHRGLTHTLYGTAVWTGLLYSTTHLQGPEIWVAGGTAYVMHLLADSLTNRGIRPLPPLKWRIRINLMSTGTKHGAVVENVCIVLALILAWIAFSPLFL
ncbi:metal-dependent hydrolase [Paenibacillus marchantiae]|uniref:metal-dependent hydrolase n=1 Tax=Paenibacillus TaxID=44249 RepID=UPI000B853A56|nr:MULTISPECIES: metal-dependent hydrolase [Paenibacillus]WDQ32214.1 metal-dependent hydrolase [Paenibacillus marchantiae]